MLSFRGTPPITEIVLEITSPVNFTVSFPSYYTPSSSYQLRLTGLSDNTEYTVQAFAVNRAGRGETSEAATFRTGTKSLYFDVLHVQLVT